MILTIRPAVRSEAEWLGANLREDDRREVETAAGLPAEQVVPLSFDQSRECYTIRLSTQRQTVEDEPCVIFGVTDDPHNKDVGIMWLLGTPRMRRAALSILREAPKWLDHFNRIYTGGIHNFVDTRNDLHVRWLLLTGFAMGDTYMLNGVPFVHVMRALT